MNFLLNNTLIHFSFYLLILDLFWDFQNLFFLYLYQFAFHIKMELPLIIFLILHNKMYYLLSLPLLLNIISINFVGNNQEFLVVWIVFILDISLLFFLSKINSSGVTFDKFNDCDINLVCVSIIFSIFLFLFFLILFLYFNYFILCSFVINKFGV